MAALGSDGGEYLQRLKSWGLDTSLVRQDAEAYTAQAIIITDQDNNQITAFHPGAMQQAHATAVPTERGDIVLAIIAPDGRDAMIDHAAQLAAAKIPFVFDPGQGLPMFDGDELRRMGCRWAGRWRAAWRWATRSARSRSPSAAGKTTASRLRWSRRPEPDGGACLRRAGRLLRGDASRVARAASLSRTAGTACAGTAATPARIRRAQLLD